MKHTQLVDRCRHQRGNPRTRRHLTFLGQGSFEAKVIEDGDDSDFRTHKESYKTAKRTVTNKDTLHLKLAPGGGACVLLAAPVNHRTINWPTGGPHLAMPAPTAKPDKI